MAGNERATARWLLRGGIAKLELSAHETLVLLALLDRMDRAGVAWPSQLRLARDLGMGRATVQRALYRLLELGVVVEHEPGRSGRSTRYRVVIRSA